MYIYAPVDHVVKVYKRYTMLQAHDIFLNLVQNSWRTMPKANKLRVKDEVFRKIGPKNPIYEHMWIK